MSQALRKLNGIVSTTKTIVLFINQTRLKIGVFFGNPETTTGGTALKFYSSLRLEIRRAAQIKQGEKIIGSRAKVKVVKNKVAAPFRTTEFDIMYNEGISVAGDMIDTGVFYKIIVKNGNTYTFGNEKLGVGRENAKDFLRSRPDMIKQISERIWEVVKAGEAPEEENGKPGEKEDVEE
jgi:recombination protein RecA